MSQKTIEQRVQDVLDEILRNHAMEEAFCPTVDHNSPLMVFNKQTNVTKVKNLFIKLAEESKACVEMGDMTTSQGQKETKDKLEIALQAFVDNIYKARSEGRITVLCDTLESLVESNTIPPKNICDVLLAHTNLDVSHPLHWNATFKTIRRIIGGVDYKGVRDMLKVFLEKCQDIDKLGSKSISYLPQLEIISDTICYVIDRNACLMPAYFAIYELLKVFPHPRKWPHWLGKTLDGLVNSFRPSAQIVSIAGRSRLLPVVGHSMAVSNVWRLNSTSLSFQLSGPLPYDQELLEPQYGLLRYVLEQTYSRELVCTMLGLNKQAKVRCEALENQLVELVVAALERYESEPENLNAGGAGSPGDEVNPSQLHWQHLSSQLIFFVLFQFASFSHMVHALYEKLKGKNLRKGRDHLMWVLLQFISGSIQKNPITDFLPVLKLYDLLYDDKEVIPVPDITKASATHALASTCIWIHLNKKAENDKLSRPIPYGLREHLEFLKQTHMLKTISTSDYKIALLCNAYSTDTDYFARPMGHLLETIYGNQKNTTLLPGNIVASAPCQPLSMNLLDSLTVHAKMSLIHSIVTRVIKLAKTKSATALAPALVETYSRLLVYMEIESLGIKGFISQLLPTVVEHQALGILHTLLEMFSYRLHHTQIHYRVQLLSHLYTLASIQQANQNQLHLCVESTALRLITSLGSSEVQPQLSRIATESKGSQNILTGESEELNRALVLTLARAMEITGVYGQDSFPMAWCKDILTSIQEHTPMGWSSATLQYFPASLAEFFREKAPPPENKAQLKNTVDTEYAKWRSMANDNDIIAHFTMQGTPPLFLCIIWKNILDENRVPSVAYKVLDRLGPRALSGHLRRFCDYLAFELANSTSNLFGRYFEALSDMMWKYNILTIDRFFLCLVLRNLEDTEAQVRFIIIQYLITRNEFKSRVVDFVRENSPEHWRQNNWHEKHMAFHKAYPEKFYYEGIQDLQMPIQHQYLPVYFGNVCLRFIPVFDVMIHRLLEQPPVQKIMDAILDHIGCLYKFHDHPVTYLYNTLFYYEKRLGAVPQLKRRLVSAIIGAFKEIRPPNWCLSEEYKTYLQQPADDLSWKPDHDYYINMVSRLVNTINGKHPPPFPYRDWRFNEFPNAAAHALHATCVELMALPVPGAVVGSALLDVVLRSSSQVPHDKLMDWMNAVGLILTALPESYWVVLNDRIMSAINSPALTSPVPDVDPFRMFGYGTCHSTLALTDTSQLLGLCHAIWHHAGIGQLSHLPQFVREKLRPVIRTEEQLLFLCHLIGPFLQRFHLERTRCLMELTVELYEILVKVDKQGEHMRYIDPICDFLYHIKYMFVGDGVKNEVEKVICNLRPAVKLRLRFISHINVEDLPEQQRLSLST
ncbi:mediator of RNA polymerase II transcription subunit 23-like isoform X2 [Littorina saxatilis]|uniref:Mediator of RNA polymerase II transcription subunit 23 n=1 Tax=Littorina saxatilis TaxID=31220 RepID=A0AAN9B9C8_9CAEN